MNAESIKALWEAIKGILLEIATFVVLFLNTCGCFENGNKVALGLTALIAANRSGGTAKMMELVGQKKADAFTIDINGKQHIVSLLTLTHEQICELAGKSSQATVTYLSGSGSGSTIQGQSIPVTEGMIITCVFTGNA